MIDSHAHLTDERFAGEEAEVVARAADAGLSAAITVATTLADAHAAVALAERFGLLYATAGIHPHSAAEASAEALEGIRALATNPRVVAIGETGLDYHYDFAPREVQRDAFVAQIQIARDLDLPVIVHSREADDDLIAILRDVAPGTRGVLHSFSGSAALLDAGLAAGWHISFSGMVTFKRYDGEELVRRVPLDRLLVETDSPYLAPAPHRGKRNEPALVPLVARRVAELRGEAAEEVAAASAATARALFRLGA